MLSRANILFAWKTNYGVSDSEVLKHTEPHRFRQLEMEKRRFPAFTPPFSLQGQKRTTRQMRFQGIRI